MPTLTPPVASTPATDSVARIESWNLVTAKYKDAGDWATWAANIMNDDIVALKNLLGTDTVDTDLQALSTALGAIAAYTPPAGFTYTAPTAPTYDTIPAYSAQTLGTIIDIPAVDAITVGNAPSTAVSISNGSYTDTLLTSLKDRLASDIATFSTGLGNAEAALFGRETARVNAQRATAYNEITTSFSSRGFDMPPGALLAKQTEINNESSLRLADSSAQIMAESARLAVDYNKHMLTLSTQLMDALIKAFDSKVMRDFEAEKIRVTMAIEGFKQEVSVALAKADLNKTAISATIAANEGTVKVFQSKIEGQIAPIKALAEVNQAKAGAYNAEVQAATANLNAQVIPEELKLKGVQANAAIASMKADVITKEVSITLENKARQLALEVSVMQGLAQSAQQIVASALNGVSVTGSFGWSAQSSTSYPHVAT
jgi:hypothetical protein